MQRASASLTALARATTSASTRSISTRSTVTTVGRLVRPANFGNGPSDDTKTMYLTVAIDDLRGKLAEGEQSSIFQTLSMLVRSQAQQDFWASIKPGSIVHGQGNITASSIDTNGMPDYPAKLTIRCGFIDLVNSKQSPDDAAQATTPGTA